MLSMLDVLSMLDPKVGSCGVFLDGSLVRSQIG